MAENSSGSHHTSASKQANRRQRRESTSSAQRSNLNGQINQNNGNRQSSMHAQQSKTPNNRRRSSNSYVSGGKNSSYSGNHGGSVLGSHTVERRGSQDMRELTAALIQAREGAGDVAEILMCSAFRPRLPGLTKMLSKLGKDGSWKKALELFEAAVNIGMCEPDTALTNAVVSACDKGGQWQKALEFFDKFERMGIKRDAITYSATINALGKGKQWEAALKVFDHMKLSGVRADVVTCCSLINALEKSGQWEMAETLFYYMKGDPIPENNEVVTEVGGLSGGAGGLDSFGPVGGQGNAINGLNGNFNSNVSGSNPSPSPNSVLRSVLRHNSLMSQLATVNEDNVVVPDDDFGSLGFILSPEDVIGTPVSAGSDQSGVSNTSSLSLGLPNAGLNARRDSVSSTYSGGGHVPQNLLMEFASLGMDDSGNGNQTRQGVSQQYDPALHQFPGDGNSLRRSVSCFPDVNGQDEPLSPSDLAKKIDFSHAHGVHPNRVCCNALMGAFARARPTQWRKAVDFVAYLWLQDESIQPDVITYNTALKACSCAFQLKQIEMLLADMNTRGVSPNTATFQFIIEAATESHSSFFLTSVIRWLEDYPSLKDKCSSQLVVACIRCNMRDEALDIFEDRLTSSSHGVSEASEAVFNGLIMHKDCDSVIRLLDLMCEMRTLPSMGTCNSIIDFLCSNNYWEAAANLLENMISSDSLLSDSMLSVSTVNSIFRAMCSAIAEGVSPAVPSPPRGGGPRPPPARMLPKDLAKLIVPRAKTVFGWFGTRIPCRANQETFGLMVQINSFAEEYAEVLIINQIMTKQGCYPDQDTMNYILLASFERGDTNNAIRLMTQLIMSGVAISNTVISRGFEEALARGDWHLAQMICESLEKQNAPQNSIGFMYEALLRKVLESGDNGTAMKLINALQHKPFIQPNSMVGPVMGSGGFRPGVNSMNSIQDGLRGVSSMIQAVGDQNNATVQQSTDSSTLHSSALLFTPTDYQQSLSASSQSQPSNRDIVNGLFDEWISAGFLPADVANDVMSMRNREACTTPEELLDIICRVAKANNGAKASEAVRMCCSLHTRAGALDFYHVPNMYGRQGEKQGWQQDINLEQLAFSTTAVHVIVASWVLAAQEAVAWDLGLPAFGKFNILISASSSEQVGKLSLGLIQLLTRGHSAVIPESRPGSGNSGSATTLGLPRFQDASVTLFQQDETSGVVEVAVNGLPRLKD